MNRQLQVRSLFQKKKEGKITSCTVHDLLALRTLDMVIIENHRIQEKQNSRKEKEKV
jgi:hypothetical protein